MGGAEDYNNKQRRNIIEEIEELQNILLCSKCYKENEYIIPNCLVDTDNNEIEYECHKHGILNEDNIFYFKTCRIKDELNECQIHKEIKYCAWCKICHKNICHLCFSEELKKNHNYILYNSLLNENEEEKFVKKKIIDIKNYYKEIILYYKDITKYQKEIILLKKIIKSNEYYYNLFYKKNIINYQTIFGLKNNMKILMDNYSKYAYMYRYKYSIFLSFIKGKDIKELNQKKVIFKEKYNILDVVIFNSELFDEKNDENNSNKGYNKAIFLYCSNSNDNKCILIYNMEGNLLNTIYYNFKTIRVLKFMQYKSNILLILNKEDFSDIFFTFYIFSSDFEDYEIKKIYFKFSNLGNNFFNEDNAFKNINICSFANETKIFKIENNIILLFYLYNIYIIKINDSSIFGGLKYYKDNNLKKDANMKNQIEVIHHFKYFLNIIPIYNTNIDNKGIINFIALNFDSELAPEDELLLTQSAPLNTFINQHENYDESNYVIKERYIIKLKNLICNYENLVIYDNINQFFKAKKIVSNSIERIKIYAKLKKFDKEFEYQNLSKFPLCLTDNLNLMKMQVNKCDLIYCYSKNYILLLLNNTVYQINFNTGEVITIYELDIHINININKGDVLSQYRILTIIHYFNKDLNKFDELILLTNTFPPHSIYPYFWRSDEIEQIKPFCLPDFKNIYEVNFFESSSNILQDSLNMERILVDIDGMTIFK